MTVTMVRPDPVLIEDEDDDNDEVAHTYCCDPDRSLCGESLYGGDFVDDGNRHRYEDCHVCEDMIVAGAPCGALFCKLRQRWRDR